MELAQQPETKPVRYRATKQTFEWCNYVRIQDPKQKVSDPPQLHERLLQFRTHTWCPRECCVLNSAWPSIRYRWEHSSVEGRRPSPLRSPQHHWFSPWIKKNSFWPKNVASPNTIIPTKDSGAFGLLNKQFYLPVFTFKQIYLF